MLKLVVIEDEFRTRETIINIINIECPEVDVVGSVSDVESGIDVINTFQIS